MTDEIFDFGFTPVDEAELEVVQSASSSVEETQERLDQLYNAIQPLLDNLKQKPEKEYILWPNRLEKIEQFENHIQKIYQG